MSKFKLGDLVRKIKGSEWHGRVVGTYSTALTPEGYCVESASHTGSVQIYPASALEELRRVPSEKTKRALAQAAEFAAEHDEIPDWVPADADHAAEAG
jgi:hypothetical protein